MSRSEQTPNASGADTEACDVQAGDTQACTISLGPLDKRIGYLVRRAQLAIFQDFIAGFGDLDIRPAQYSILTVIETNPGLSQTQVADALGIKKTNFVAMINALEKRGLACRKPTLHDKRSYALFLTEQGQSMMIKLHAIADGHEQRVIDRIGPAMHAALFAPLRAIAALADGKGALED